MLLKGKKQNGVDRTLPSKISTRGVEVEGSDVIERKETKWSGMVSTIKDLSIWSRSNK